MEDIRYNEKSLIDFFCQIEGKIMDETQRLEAFEKMLQAVQTEYENIVRQMNQLKEKGKIKSVTYQQLLARKMTYQNMLSMYALYDLIDGEKEQ